MGRVLAGAMLLSSCTFFIGTAGPVAAQGLYIGPGGVGVDSDRGYRNDREDDDRYRSRRHYRDENDDDDRPRRRHRRHHDDDDDNQ